MKNLAFFDRLWPKSLHFENGIRIRYGHSYNYNGRRIGTSRPTRMRSIEWCHFQ